MDLNGPKSRFNPDPYAAEDVFIDACEEIHRNPNFIATLPSLEKSVALDAGCLNASNFEKQAQLKPEEAANYLLLAHTAQEAVIQPILAQPDFRTEH
jgi:hypothetical protein